MAISLNSPKYADVNSLAYQMHKKQQDRKKRNASLLRYFRLSEGGTDYLNIPSVSTPGDYMFTFKVSTSSTVADSVILALATNTFSERLWVALVSGSGGLVIKVSTSGFTPSQGTKVINDGVIHDVRFIKQGNDFSVYVDGVLDYTVTHTDPLELAGSYSVIACAGRFFTGGTVTNHLNAVLSDLTYTSAGVLERDYPINDNGNTIRDLVSGQDGTVINPNAGDWGLFKEKPTLWEGQNLTAPPWDSVDQELIKA